MGLGWREMGFGAKALEVFFADERFAGSDVVEFALDHPLLELADEFV